MSDPGAVFPFGLSHFFDSSPAKFWVKNDPVTELSCGEEHSFLVTENGRAFAFGKNEWGQLGVGNNESQTRPKCLKYLKAVDEKVKFVACGRYHTLISTYTDALYSCGSNSDGQLGVEREEKSPLPILIESWKNLPIKQLAAGSDFSALVTASGELYMWGCNSEGQLAHSTEIGTIGEPRLVRSLPGPVSMIACGHYHAAAILEDGRLFIWGEADGGKLGLGQTVSESDIVSSPREVRGIQGGVKWVACGNNHTLAVSTSGLLYCWGQGSVGQLGLGDSSLYADSPQKIVSSPDQRFISVYAGESHSAALTDTGELLVCGDGRHGKLCDYENQENKFVFTVVKRFLSLFVSKVSCGGCHTLVLAQRGIAAVMSLSKGVISESAPPVKSRSIRAREKRLNKRKSDQLQRTLPLLAQAKPSESPDLDVSGTSEVTETFTIKSSTSTESGNPNVKSESNGQVVLDDRSKTPLHDPENEIPLDKKEKIKKALADPDESATALEEIFKSTDTDVNFVNEEASVNLQNVKEVREDSIQEDKKKESSLADQSLDTKPPPEDPAIKKSRHDKALSEFEELMKPDVELPEKFEDKVDVDSPVDEEGPVIIPVDKKSTPIIDPNKPVDQNDKSAPPEGDISKTSQNEKSPELDNKTPKASENGAADSKPNGADLIDADPGLSKDSNSKLEEIDDTNQPEVTKTNVCCGPVRSKPKNGVVSNQGDPEDSSGSKGCVIL